MKLFLCTLAIVSLSVIEGKVLTKRPIIGILTQQPSSLLKEKYPGYTSFISSAYVKAVEGSGARVAPIFINQTDEYYSNIINSVNGVLFPGGNSWFDVPGGYAEAGEHIFKIAKKLNDKGVHFPIMGVSLGFHLMLFIDNNKKEMRIKCMVRNASLALTFKKKYRNSFLYRPAPRRIIRFLQRKRVTFNDHQYCVTEKDLYATKLKNKWKALTINNKIAKVPFITSIEAKQYPFVGLQFHPEKNQYDWKETLNIPHFHSAIQVSRYFHDWLVFNSKKNSNKFSNSTTERKSLIYNYHKEYSGAKNLIFEEIYLFK